MCVQVNDGERNIPLKSTKEIKECCKEEIRLLQKYCKHPKSNYEEFASAHGSVVAKVCEVCEKILEVKNK